MLQVKHKSVKILLQNWRAGPRLAEMGDYSPIFSKHFR